MENKCQSLVKPHPEPPRSRPALKFNLVKSALLASSPHSLALLPTGSHII